MKLGVLLALLSSALLNAKGLLNNDIYPSHNDLQKNRITCCTINYTKINPDQTIMYNNLASILNNIRLKKFECEDLFLKKENNKGFKPSLKKLYNNEYSLNYCISNPINTILPVITYYDQDDE